MILAPYAQYRLNEQECADVAEETRLARKRHAHKGPWDQENRTGRSDEEQTRDGFGAEVAFAGLSLGAWQRKRSEEDVAGSIDVILRDGRTTDTKNNYCATHTLLICSCGATGRPDLYVLMVLIAYPIFEYRGWATYAALRQRVNVDQSGRFGDPVYVLPEMALEKYLMVTR